MINGYPSKRLQLGYPRRLGSSSIPEADCAGFELPEFPLPVADRPRLRQSQQLPEFRAFHVARRATRRGVQQAVAHRTQLADGLVELVGFRLQLLPIDARLSAFREHAGDRAADEAMGSDLCDL